jgi:perosamine synthetase
MAATIIVSPRAAAVVTLFRVAIPYGRQTIDDDDVAAVERVLRSDWLTQGPAVATFEADFATYCDAPHAVAFSSGTAALHAACFAAGLAAGDELVTSAITFAASANCGAYLGAAVWFADIERSTLNVSARTIEPHLSARTRVVVPVDFAGLPAPVAEIRELVGPDVTIIEDAAHAVGATRNGAPVGAGREVDMTVFSFHPVKTMTTGEGGMVTTRSETLRDRLRVFRTHGMVSDPAAFVHPAPGRWYHEQQELGFNYRLTDIHAALGSSQLRKLDAFVGRRNDLAERYRSALRELKSLELPPAAGPGSLHAYHLFVVRHREGAAARRRLYDALREREILTQVHFLPVYRHPFHERRNPQPALAAAEEYYAGCLSLPLYPSLTEAEQDFVIDAVHELA